MTTVEAEEEIPAWFLRGRAAVKGVAAAMREVEAAQTPDERRSSCIRTPTIGDLPVAGRPRDVLLSIIGFAITNRGRLSRVAGAGPAQDRPWQCRQISFRLPLRNISMEAEPLI